MMRHEPDPAALAGVIWRSKERAEQRLKSADTEQIVESVAAFLSGPWETDAGVAYHGLLTDRIHNLTMSLQGLSSRSDPQKKILLSRAREICDALETRLGLEEPHWRVSMAKHLTTAPPAARMLRTHVQPVPFRRVDHEPLHVKQSYMDVRTENIARLVLHSYIEPFGVSVDELVRCHFDPVDTPLEEGFRLRWMKSAKLLADAILLLGVVNDEAQTVLPHFETASGESLQERTYATNRSALRRCGHDEKLQELLVAPQR